MPEKSGVGKLFIPAGHSTQATIVSSENRDFDEVSGELREVPILSVRELAGIWFSNLNLPPDYLSIDVEGLDSAILTEFLSDGFFPPVISVEHNFVRHVIAQLEFLAQRHGYLLKLRGLTRNDLLLVKIV